MRVRIIKKLSQYHDIKLLCRVLKVAKSTYYANLTRNPSKREIENNAIKIKILSIYTASKGRYGSPKITQTLHQEGYTSISVNRVGRLMKQLNIRAVTVKKFRNYRQKQHKSIGNNLLNQRFAAAAPNKVWLTDITYIHTVRHGWTYLARVLDLCTRKIVGYSYGRKMDRNLVISALEKACKNQSYPKQVVLHSDRGSQYISSDYLQVTERLGFLLSYSKKGCPYDNAPMEAFHAVLKKEEVYLRHYQSYDDAKISLFEYIEGFYNRNRIHSSIGYMSPNAFEKLSLA